MTITGGVVASLLVMAAGVPRVASAQRVTSDSNAALHRWVDAVNQHAPGVPDQAVAYVAGLTYGARAELNTSFVLFIRILREQVVETRSLLEQNVTTYARAIRADPGTSAFLKRAAILHIDARVFARRFPAPSDDAPVLASESWAPPLLYNAWTTLARDGEILGSDKGDWNLPFARYLLDVLLLRAGKDDREFVANWYHAASAYLFANNNYADAMPHLQQAARLLPDDPHALFDRGTYAEAFGLPIYQSVLDDPAMGRRRPAYDPGIPPEHRTNAEAEGLYRRVLAVDASYVEARVRLARLLERRGRVDEAAVEIATALNATVEAGVPRFYAHIVAGRVAAVRGRYDEALQQYLAASALNPQAQSAVLGASQAALMLSDVPRVLEPLKQLVGAGTPDPWWDYGIGAGRDVLALLEDLWQRARRK